MAIVNLRKCSGQMGLILKYNLANSSPVTSRNVSLEFSEGATLPDKFSVLEGEGKFRRHIKLFSEQDISDKHFREYLALALAASAKS